MNKLTFAFDVQLNDQEDWIQAGTKVELFNNPFHLNRWEDSKPVVITKAFNYKGEPIEINSTVEWFCNKSFIELQ